MKIIYFLKRIGYRIQGAWRMYLHSHYVRCEICQRRKHRSNVSQRTFQGIPSVKDGIIMSKAKMCAPCSLSLQRNIKQHFNASL